MEQPKVAQLATSIPVAYGNLMAHHSIYVQMYNMYNVHICMDQVIRACNAGLVMDVPSHMH